MRIFFILSDTGRSHVVKTCSTMHKPKIVAPSKTHWILVKTYETQSNSTSTASTTPGPADLGKFFYAVPQPQS